MIFSLPGDYLLTSLQMAASSLASVYGRLCNVRPNFDVVFQLSIDAVSIQCA